METTLQKQSLYNIRIEHLELLQWIEDNEGEITPEIENALALTEEQFQDKAISYAMVVKTFDDSESIIEKEINRLVDLKVKAEKRKELFKQRLSEAMLQFGVEKIITPLVSLSFRKSESVNVFDEKALPGQYKKLKTVETIDKTLIKESIKMFGSVPGAELVTKQNLQIK